MKLLEIFRFELAYQARRLSTWLYFALITVVSFLFVRGNYLADALYADFYINSPFVIASTTVFAGLFWFLIAAPVAGELGARDVATGMHPLTYTAPVSKTEYLGGRFLAALALNALLLLAVPLGIMLCVYASGLDAAAVGPFRLDAYLTAYGFIALPNAFVATAIQFAWAALGRRALASYLGSVVLFFVAYGGMIALGMFVGREDLAALLDVFGHVFITSDLVLNWTPIEKSTRLIALEGPLLHSRILWFAIALATLAFTWMRFQFVHHTPSSWLGRMTRLQDAHAPTPGGIDAAHAPVSVPDVPQTFGFASRARQTLAITWTSFRTIAKSWGGLVVLGGIAGLASMLLPENLQDMGTPLLPRTEYVLTFLTTPLTNFLTPWVITPLLIVLYAGELVWRERDAGLGEITDAAPVPEGVTLLGKFLGLGLVLAAWMAILMLAGILIQLQMGYHRFELGLYLRVLFGLQLPEYLLFALLALVIQGMVSQKYIGHLVALLAYALIIFADRLGLHHNLLVYGSAPGWSYTDMRGFGPTLGPWLWFMGYWAAWALLLAVLATLLWMRGLEGGIGVRLRLARRRFTGPTARAAAVAAAGLVVALGGFIFYNTNVLNDYAAAATQKERQAEYERRYARYAAVPQPRLAATRVHVEIHPRRRELEVRGTYQLVNGTSAPIDRIHVSPIAGVPTGPITFDRPATRVLVDEERGYRIYALAQPLQPGGTLRLNFAIHIKPRGFRNSGVSFAVMPKSTFFRNEVLFPVIGYQRGRELFSPGDRRKHGLRARPIIPRLAEGDAADVSAEAATRIAFEAVVGTDASQVAVAPGVLRRTWTRNGRRYFHYATDTPIGGEQSFFSAEYAVREERWNPPAGTGRPVAIQVYYHPQHAANLDRILRSVRGSLAHYTKSFGPYPHSYIRLVENPGRGNGAHAAAAMIDYTEGFSRYNPTDGPGGLDLPFAVIAHEMGHQFQVPYAYVEGAPLLSESFAWYAAMGVVENEYGREHLERLRRFFRQPSPIPPIRQSVPLLRALDPYAAYRKGAYAYYAMAEYMGQDRVNLAYRRLREKHGSGAPPLATTLDLYRELQAVTPDSLRPLLHDLFAANTFWKLETERASARQTPAGAWQVTLRVKARKLTVSPAGAETDVPMDEWVQVGVFAPTAAGAEFGETLYLRPHRVRTGTQTITVTVPRKPSDAGIDPYLLLIDLERFDNVEEVEIEQ